MKRIIMALALLALLALLLSGCVSDFLSPTTTTIDSHDRTQDAAAELSQDGSRPVCVGLLNIGSCNVTQVAAQRQTTQPAADDMGLSGLCLGLLITSAFFGLWFLAFALFGPDN